MIYSVLCITFKKNRKINRKKNRKNNYALRLFSAYRKRNKLRFSYKSDQLGTMTLINNCKLIKSIWFTTGVFSIKGIELIQTLH